MRTGETEAEMVRRHVATGRALVQRQRALIVQSIADGKCTSAADDLLRLLEETQALHEAHLERVEVT